ncbi:MAG: hypothetical protein A4E49_01659 [Methanosaeta sp. PtaU1.Bin112]|nr:MAG: hypothetical protein A4E49_01659 [Methanosaeta sp. PtaU1.Bin112]
MADEKEMTFKIKVPAKALDQFATEVKGKDGCGCGCIMGCQVKVDP